MKDAIVGAEFISLPGQGHNIHWEAPEKVAHLILTFEHETRASRDQSRTGQTGGGNERLARQQIFTP